MIAETEQPETIDREALAKMVELIMYHGATFGDAYQVSEAEREVIYARGYELQKRGKYEQAQHLFEYLCYLNHYEEGYWIALGFCREQRRRYHDALQAYVMAGVLDVDSPIPPLRSAECLMHMGELSQAKKAAEMAIRNAGDEPRFQPRRERAEFLLKAIQRRRKKAKK